MSRVLLCTGCGTKNRVDDDLKKKPLCASCGKVVFIGTPSAPPLKAEDRPPVNTGYYVIIILMVTALLAIIVKHIEGKPAMAHYSLMKLPASATIHIEPGILSQSFVNGLAPLAIKTKPGNDYYVKLINAHTKENVLVAYLHGGKLFTTRIPLGSYEIHYAAGTNWFGDQMLFGPDTAYSSSHKLFDFTSTAGSYTGYTIELLYLHNNEPNAQDNAAEEF